jgi:hypothetical protein
LTVTNSTCVFLASRFFGAHVLCSDLAEIGCTCIVRLLKIVADSQPEQLEGC